MPASQDMTREVEVMPANQDMTRGGKEDWGEEVFFLHASYLYTLFLLGAGKTRSNCRPSSVTPVLACGTATSGPGSARQAAVAV